MAKRKRKRDPHAHIARLAASSDGAGASDPAAQDARRDGQARLAANEPSAARWLVADGAGRSRAVDVVVELLALPPGTGLRGRSGEQLRGLAAAVEELVAADAACPSGVPLLEVLVSDEEDRAALAPSLDFDALLSGDGPVASTADRTIRLATAMMAAADAHRAGAVDLVTAVAPPATKRHAVADELDALLSVATDAIVWPPNPAPAVTVLDGGWVGAAPLELFGLAASGVATGAASTAIGEGLARWLDGWALGPDPWRLTVLERVPLDADALLHEAATRAGSDHPAVIGSILTELIGMRHPLA